MNFLYKILAFSDFHDRRTWYRRANSLIKKYEPNIVIIAGDLSNFGGLRKIEKLVSSLEHEKKFFIWGNMDGKRPQEGLDSAVNLHFSVMYLNGLRLMGLGGDEESFEKNLPRFRELIIDPFNEPHEHSIIVTHIPPYEHGDLIKIYRGNPQRHVGSRKYLELIKTFQPSLVICGHIHEARGIYKIGKTTICNVGKEGMQIELGDVIKITDLIDEE